MPSKEKILAYWIDKIHIEDCVDTCFKCGEVGQIERAHITSVYNGGTDELDNLHLLCKGCHAKSEAWEGDAYKLWFNHNGIHEQFSMVVAANYFVNNLDLSNRMYKEFVNSLENAKKQYLSSGKSEDDFDRFMLNYL